jgi:transposase InsO family protein
MAWGTVDVDEQRVRFVVSASRREKSLQELCKEFEISRPTGYAWLRRYQAGGIAGVVEKSRRPHHSPGRTPRVIEQRVVALRRQRPDWGARKVQMLLQEEGIDLPVITVHRIFQRHGLVREQDGHAPAVGRFERGSVNQLWQMDFKSPVGWEAPVGPLSVLDDHSRYAIALRGTWTTQAEPVKQGLIEAFERCGMPDEMLMDHGTPWWNMKAVAGWTWLTVWLMKQGIRVHLSGYRHPQTQGKVERFHGALAAAAKRRGYPPSGERQKWLDEFRLEYNQVRPHEALGMRTPGSVWSPSPRHYQAQPRRWDYEAGAEVRRLSASGRLSVEGRGWEISRALAEEWVQLVRIGERILVYYCRSLVRELDLPTQRSTAVDRWVAPHGQGRPLCKGCPDNAV